MAASSGKVRYSTTNVENSEPAKAFTWEQPVPVNNFWDSFDYCTSRSFLSNFTEEELSQLPIDPDSTASRTEKLELLLRVLEMRLAEEDAASAPQTVYQADFARWNQLMLGIYTMQMELNLPEADRTIRMLVDKRQDKSNLQMLHVLADHLIKTGQFAEAEQTEWQVCKWMDGHERLGRDSPQAINSRRVIARAMWMQGSSKRAEAEKMIREIKDITESVSGGRFAVYQEMERGLNVKMISGLEKAG